jgi:hypothetical protein
MERRGRAFIGGGGERRNGRALTRIEEGKLQGGNGLQRRFRSREEEPDRWVPVIRGRERGEAYPFGKY